MTIVADHRFFQQVGSGSIHKALEAIVWHIEEVDHLYRQADWNNDKAPDRIGVSYSTEFRDDVIQETYNSSIHRFIVSKPED